MLSSLGTHILWTFVSACPSFLLSRLGKNFDEEIPDGATRATCVEKLDRV